MEPRCSAWKLKLIEISREDRVLTVTLNRPEKRNALNLHLCRQLGEILDGANADETVGSILLTGSGTSFCAGMDLREALDPSLTDIGPVHESLFTVINRLRKPLIAAVHGAALGGGTGLVANAHIVIAHPDAQFGLTEIRIGLWPVLIFRPVALAIGERRATELSITGRSFGAEEALRLGLVSEIADDPMRRATDIAAAVSQLSAGAIASGLKYTEEIRNRNWDEAGRLGLEMRSHLMASSEFHTRVEAFFARKRTEPC